MKKSVVYKDFELHKVKFNAKKGLEIEFYDVNEPNDLWKVNSDSQPSEEYVGVLNELKEVLAYSLGLNNAWDFAREHNRKNEDALKKAQLLWKDEIARCNVTGITVVGVEDSKGIKISGSLGTDLGVVGLPSPIIRFEDDIVNSVDATILIGEMAQTVFEKLQAEVWMFIFKNKRGGELFPADESESGLNVTPEMKKVG